jgi:hypothetical protein
VTTCAEITLKLNMATSTMAVDAVHFGRPPLRTNNGGQRRKAKAFLMMLLAEPLDTYGPWWQLNATILAFLPQAGVGRVLIAPSRSQSDAVT